MVNKNNLSEKLKKRGITHVEAILSFVIFIGFIFFILPLFISFFEDNEDNSVYLDSLERNIILNVSSKLSFFTINTSKMDNNDCFEFEFSSSEGELSNIIVKDKDGNIVDGICEGYGNDKYKISINDEGGFYYIYSSRGFEENEFSGNCEEIEGDDFDLSLFRSYLVSSNKSLYNLKKNYEDNYYDLKKNLEVPQSKDFVFLVRDTIGNENILNLTFTKPEGVSVAARNVPIQIIYSNGSLKYAILNLQIW